MEFINLSVQPHPLDLCDSCYMYTLKIQKSVCFPAAWICCVSSHHASVITQNPLYFYSKFQSITCGAHRLTRYNYVCVDCFKQISTHVHVIVLHLTSSFWCVIRQCTKNLVYLNERLVIDQCTCMRGCYVL